MTPSLWWVSVPNSFVSLFIFYILSYLLLKTMGCLSGCLVSSASVQKLFCGVCSAFKWSFDEFVGEKVVSLSYSSAILGPPPKSIISKEGWVTKNQCFQTVVLEKTLESPLDSKEIKPFNPKGNQLWIFIGRIDAEAPILWSPDAKSRLIEKVPDVGKDWGQEKKETTEDEMVRWHHWLNGHESERTLGDGEGQESLVCCSPWGHKEADMRKRLNKNNNNNY